MRTSSWIAVVLFSLLALSCGKEQASSTATLGADPRNYSTDALIYNGTGAAPADVAAIVDIVDSNGLSYRLADEGEFEKLSVDDIARHGVIIWPGGYGGKVTKAMSAESRARVREAVVSRGVSYLGICAGAFLAASPPDYGFSIITRDKLLPEFAPNGKFASDNAVLVPTTLPGGVTRKIDFLGGPYFPDASEVLARYNDGSPAMMQAVAGAGFVVLTGPHPESPTGWASSYTDEDGKKGDIALAENLIDAALNRRPLPVL